MLDEFHYGSVTRISPEAPTPVIAVQRQETMVGGAGNVARNIVALGAHCALVGVVGEEETGRLLMREFAKARSTERYIVLDRQRPAYDSQGPLRLRAPFDPSVARRLGALRGGRGRA